MQSSSEVPKLLALGIDAVGFGLDDLLAEERSRVSEIGRQLNRNLTPGFSFRRDLFPHLDSLHQHDIEHQTIHTFT